MVTIQMSDLTATWDGDQWTGKDATFVALLNACRYLSAGYLPDELNARAMAQRALGKTGWQVIRSDDQPIEPGMIY